MNRREQREQREIEGRFRARGHKVSEIGDRSWEIGTRELGCLGGRAGSGLHFTLWGRNATYDARNRAVSMADTQEQTEGKNRQTVYDAHGNVVGTTDAKSQSASSAFDARDRRVSETDRLAGVTSWRFDENSNLRHLTDAENQSPYKPTAWSYDARNLKLCEALPGHNPTSQIGDADYDLKQFTYDLAGRVDVATDQKGNNVTHLYDLASRLLQRDYRLFNQTAISDSDVFSYGDAGRMASAESGRYNNTVAFGYDAAGRLTSESLTVTFGQTTTYTVQSAYDAANRRTGITYPDGSVVARQYTARDQVAQIDYNSSMVASFAYDNGLRRTSRTLGDTPGTQTTWVYGRQDNLPTAINSGIPGTSFSYTYDANKNKLTEGISTPMANYGFNSTSYDQADRLTAWNRTDGNLDQAWDLSLVGNWATFTQNQVQQTRTHTSVHEIAAIDSAPIAHDPTGNLIRNAGDTLDRYTWDFDNRLATADTNQDGTAECGYQYDARGKRVSNTVPDGEGSVTTVFVYLGNQVVSEYAADALPASPERKFVYATYIDEPLVMIDRTTAGTVAAGTDELLFYHCNLLYSVAAITDATATVVERYAYSAYGRPLIFDAGMQSLTQSAIGNPYAFTGRRLDPETSLYYYRARMYDAELGRFVSRDPIGYDGGSNVLYGYVNARPVYDTDPLGLKPDNPADPCTCCKEAFAHKFGYISVTPDGKPADPNGNSVVQDYEAPNGNDCRVTLTCEPTGDCGKGKGVGTTTHPEPSDSPRITYDIGVCIPCTSLNKEEADALLVHEWVHVTRFCQAGKGPSSCDDCALHETAAYEAQCDMLHTGRPGASDAIKKCIQCGVWKSCKDFKGTDGERCGKEGSALDKMAKQLKCK